MPPVAQDSEVLVVVGTSVVVPLLASDPDGHALSWSIVEQPTLGTLSGDGGNRIYTSTSAEVGRDELVFEVDDGQGGTAKGTVALSIIPAVEAPTITTSPGAATYWMHDPPTVIDAGVTVTFARSPTLDGASVAITSGRFQLNDGLTFHQTGAIAGTYDENTGVLTLSGTAPVADYEAAMRTVRYFNHATPPTTDPRTITFGSGGGAGNRMLTVVASENPNTQPTGATG